MEVSIEQLVKVTTNLAFQMALDIMGDDMEYMSERAARTKYKGLLELWERKGLIHGIPTTNGKHLVYSKRRIIELWKLHEQGLE